MNNSTKKILLILIFLLLVNWGCHSSKKNNPQNQDQVKSTLNIYNVDKPKYGVVSLKAVPTLSISSESIPKSNRKAIPFFYTVRKDSKGNFYFMDYHSVSIYKFDSNGKFVMKFLRKGNGPGELPQIHKFEIFNDIVFCSNRDKICNFDIDGNFLSENRLKKSSLDIIENVDSSRYISCHNIYDDKNKSGISCVLINKNQVQCELFKLDNPKIGYSTLKIHDKYFNYLGATSPRIEYRLNPYNNLVYFGYNFDYKVYIVNLSGKTLKAVHKDFIPIKISDEYIQRMANSFKKMGWPLDYTQAFKRNPPEKTWPVIDRICFITPKYFGVIHRISATESAVDVFDLEGHLVYKIIGSEELKIRGIKFFNKSIGKIESKETHDVFTRYRVTNLPLIYHN